jgi:hypothetical protein
MQILVADIKEGMVIDDGTHDTVKVSSVWDQGRGLGVVIKGQHVDDGTTYHRRFLDYETTVEVK